MRAAKAELAVVAAAGLVAVFGNVAAVALLGDVEGAYRLAGLARWVESAHEHAQASAWSAWAFTVGLLALAIWALGVSRFFATAPAFYGAAIIAMGALLNAAGTMAPLVLVAHVGDAPGTEAVGRALLGFTLALDAFFNLTLFAGLALLAWGWSPSFAPWLRWLALAAALASLPVAAQAQIDDAARLLAVAGPLWLLLIAVFSALLLGERRA